MPTGHKPSYSIISKKNPPRPPIRRRTGRQRPMRSRIVERPRPDLRSTTNGRSLPPNRRRLLRLLPMREIAIAPPLPPTRRERSGRTEITSRKRRKQASRRTHFHRSDPDAPASCCPLPASGPYTRPRKAVAVSEAARMPYADASITIRHHGSFRTMPFHAAAVPSNDIDKTLLRCDVYFAVFLRSKGIPYRATLGLGPIHPTAKNMRSIRGRMPRADPSIDPRIPGRGTPGDRGRHLEAMVGNQRSATGVRKTRPPISRFFPLKILSGKEQALGKGLFSTFGGRVPPRAA